MLSVSLDDFRKSLYGTGRGSEEERSTVRR
jgi:hypothetical protein